MNTRAYWLLWSLTLAGLMLVIVSPATAQSGSEWDLPVASHAAPVEPETWVAWAAQARPASAGQRPSALSQIDAGVEAYKAGDYTRALKLFERAARAGKQVKDRSGLYYNIGSCLRKLGRIQAAVAAYEKSLAYSANPDAETRTKEWIAQLKSTAVGQVRVGCNLEGATVSVGALETECSGLLERVPVGSHAVLGRTAAGVTAKAEVVVEANQTAKVMLTFGGDIAVNLKMLGAVVAVDSEEKGMPPLRVNGIPAGRRVVEVRAPQGTASVSVAIVPGELNTLTIRDFPALDPSTDAQPDRTWAKVAIGGGAGLMAVGAAYLVVGFSDHGDARDMPLTTDDEVFEANRVLNAGTESINTGWIYMAVGLAGVGVGAWLYQDDGDDAAARLELSATGDSAFVRWRMGW